MIRSIARFCIATALACAPIRAHADAACPTQVAHVDTSVATTSEVEVLGDDFGQTFVARDSFITRVVLWQPTGKDVYGGPATVLIFDADSLGRPSLRVPILTGPSAPIPTGGTAAKIPLVFDCQPAIHLPHLGYFEVAFLAPCGSRLWFLHTSTDVLPDGHFFWNRVGRCPALSQSNSYPDQDVLIDLEFCDHDPYSPPPPPPPNATWGRVKVIYRGPRGILTGT